jgi:hypothetical protein
MVSLEQIQGTRSLNAFSKTLNYRSETVLADGDDLPIATRFDFKFDNGE